MKNVLDGTYLAKETISNCISPTMWTDLVGILDGVLEKKSPTGMWYVRGENMGWDKMNGTMEVKLEVPHDSEDFMMKVLPDCDWTISIYHKGRHGLQIKCGTHDSMGEWYYCMAMKRRKEDEM